MPIQNVQPDEQAMQAEYERSLRKETPEQPANFIYSLKKGITQLRIMPPLPGQKKWLREVREHAWNPGGKFRRDICPTNFGAPCPVCEEGKSLYQTTDEDSVTRSKDFRPTRQFFVNAVILVDPEGPQAAKGVQVVRFGPKVQAQLVHLDRDFAGGWGKMTDLTQGFDVRIERTGNSKETTEYFVHGVPMRTNFAEVLRAQGLDINKFNLHNLDEFGVVLPYEELKRLSKENFVPGFDATPTVANLPTTIGGPPNFVMPPLPLSVVDPGLRGFPTGVPIVPPPFTTTKGEKSGNS